MRIFQFISIIAIYFALSGCQKARLVEEWPESADQGVNGRNGQTEQGDTINVTPEFDINGWEGVIDVNFGFGGEN